MKTIRSTSKLLSTILLLSVQLEAGIGDPGMVYDSSGNVNSFYGPKQQIWATAGVVGGIRNHKETSVTIPGGASVSTIQTEINNLSNSGGGVIKFGAGTWNIGSTLFVKKNVVLEGAGDGPTGTIFKDTRTTSGNVIVFNDLRANTGHTVGGIRKIRLVGPGTGTPDRTLMEDALPNLVNIMLTFADSENLFVDQVTILNSGSTAFYSWAGLTNGGHYTVRDSTIDGAWNKGGGGHGYFSIQAPYCLVYNNLIQNLRHCAIQTTGASYSVLYDNIINIDVNFHNADSGNNLVEKNTITLDSAIVGPGGTLHGTRYVVMGPWSVTQHNPSLADNYVYANTVFEHGRSTPRCSHQGMVYKGASCQEADGNPFATQNWIDEGKRMYSIKPTPYKYIDATMGNTTLNGVGLSHPSNIIANNTMGPGNDNKWTWRTDGTGQWEGGNVFECDNVSGTGDVENTAPLVTTINIPAIGTYEFVVIFSTENSRDIAVKHTSQPLVSTPGDLFTLSSQNTQNPDQALVPRELEFDSSYTNGRGSNAGAAYIGKITTITANQAVKIYVNGFSSTSASDDERTRYDGIGYRLTGKDW